MKRLLLIFAFAALVLAACAPRAATLTGPAEPAVGDVVQAKFTAPVDLFSVRIVFSGAHGPAEFCVVSGFESNCGIGDMTAEFSVMVNAIIVDLPAVCVVTAFASKDKAANSYRVYPCQ